MLSSHHHSLNLIMLRDERMKSKSTWKKKKTSQWSSQKVKSTSITSFIDTLVNQNTSKNSSHLPKPPNSKMHKICTHGHPYMPNARRQLTTVACLSPHILLEPSIEPSELHTSQHKRWTCRQIWRQYIKNLDPRNRKRIPYTSGST
jgi:hypothetical protein